MMLTNSNFSSFDELNAALKRVVDMLNRRGVASVNGMIDIDEPYTVNGVPGMAGILRTEEGWTFCTEL